MSVMDVCGSTVHWYDRAMYATQVNICPLWTCVFQHFICTPGHLSHVGQQSVCHVVVFSTLGLYACPFKPGRSTNYPSGTCLLHPSFLPDILECIRGGVYLGYGMTSP